MGTKRTKWEDAIREAIEQHPLSMLEASKWAKMPYRTFIERAKRLGIYQPNQSGKGTTKRKKTGFFELEEILKGNHPNYQTAKLKRRLLKAGIKHHKCEICNITDWRGEALSFHLDHIDGDVTNHRLWNLRILCPNCHSQTDTYTGRNKKKKGNKLISDDDFLIALRDNTNIRQALISLNLEPKGANYQRANKLLKTKELL